MDILYEDRQIISVIKPAGISSQETQQDDDMPKALKALTGGEIFPVHRLDITTGGVMVYAKTSQAAAFLSEEIAKRRFCKEYLAAIYGKPAEESSLFEDLLFRDAKKNKSYVVKRERGGVKKASLSYTLLSCIEKDAERLSLVKIRLHTGRSHQIRVQFASRGMPLIGDGKYGAKDNKKNIALQSVMLSFSHPQTKQRLTIEIPPDKQLFGMFFEQ